MYAETGVSDQGLSTHKQERQPPNGVIPLARALIIPSGSKRPDVPITSGFADLGRSLLRALKAGFLWSVHMNGVEEDLASGLGEVGR